MRLLPHKGKEPYVSFYKILSFYPYNITLYQQALLHKSSSIKMKDGRWINNERLEFLGDAILDAIVADIVFKGFEYKKEGFLTNMRSKLVQRETLNQLALDLGIDKLITASTSTRTHKTHIYGNALEALIGAIYLDQGYRVAKKFVSDRLLANLDIENVAEKEVNFKSRLLEWSQKAKLEVSFEVVSTEVDSNNNPIFHSVVFVCNQEVGKGTGFSKKESHQNAAKVALERIKSDPGFKKALISISTEVEKEDIENKEKDENI